ncbi:MAG: PAS domain S-box protein [Gammaproteobacteria bacterium]|nr:PAS domain S-box protein [Gammaproteobacteria bacterium]
MNFDLATLAAMGSGYLLLLFGIAWATDRRWIPEKIVLHPLTYTLSLGVFASVWAYYTSVGIAMRHGYGYLAAYIGISLAFMFSPLLLRPLRQLTRTYQLSSLADLIAFRFRSRLAGTLVTLLTLAAVVPIIALQIRAVSDTAGILSPEAADGGVAVGFCVLITLFSILFGTSQRAGGNRHDGLVVAIAFESLVKLVAFLAVGAFAVGAGFGGPGAMQDWLQGRPDLLENLRAADFAGSFHVLALLFFAAAVAMPHMFYATFNENRSLKALAFASWCLPLYFLLISLPVLPILWAGLLAETEVPVVYFPVVIGAAWDTPWLSLLAYVGGLSAASGLIIVITLALSNMCLNHLILPLQQPSAKDDIYRWLLRRRRLLITLVIWAGFLFHVLPEQQIGLDFITVLAFSACLQFLPGALAILYWRRGNARGFMAGLAGGAAVWFWFILLPVFYETSLEAGPLSLDSVAWREAAALSLIINAILFALVSLYSKTSNAERHAAEICSLDTVKHGARGGLVAKSPAEFIESLGKPLGEKVAGREVQQALQDAGIDMNDRRPFALRLLRARLEANLSGLMGPSVAQDLIDRYLPYGVAPDQPRSDVTLIESRIEAYRSNLSGLAAELDSLRRYHRQMLLELPLGVCSVSVDREIVMWNQALEELTGIQESEVVGLRIEELDRPWRELLVDFVAGESDHAHKGRFEFGGRRRTVNLHKALIEKSMEANSPHEGMIVLIEDITETEDLEAGLAHSARLASIGQLAAGIAHEIGNPVTGIACLAQTIRDEYQDEEVRNLANQIVEQTDRTSHILQSLMNFAHFGERQAEAQEESVNVFACMEEAATLISLDRKARKVELLLEGDREAMIDGDSQRLLQVLVNLIGNARDASRPGAPVRIACRTGGNGVEVTVEDEGTGISPAIRDRIFEPFFTTKEPGAGTGLGLSLVYGTVEDFKGDIDIISPVDRVQGCGTRVVLHFPPPKATAKIRTGY